MKGLAFARAARSQIIVASLSSLFTMGIVGAGAYAVGLIPASDGTINACYDRQNGNLRVVAVAGDCRTAELPIQWNQRGPQGLTGPKGDSGAQGARGDTGAQGLVGGIGATGATGPQGPKGDTGVAGGSGVSTPPPVATYHVSITKSGLGSGTVASFSGLINCGALCAADVPVGSTTDLGASADQGSFFGGWGGACTGTGNCTVSASADVTARFDAGATLTITTAGDGGGPGSRIIVQTQSGPISCVNSCVLPLGTVVNVFYQPDLTLEFASQFLGFSGDCTGQTCTLTMDGPRSVTITVVPYPTLTVTVQGAGTVQSQAYSLRYPNGALIGDPNGGARSYPIRILSNPVTLTAFPMTGAAWHFDSWAGACVGTVGPVCSITVTASTSVIAIFVPD